jgi:hypothetical protein
VAAFLAVVGASTLRAGIVRAQETGDLLSGRHKSFESPQHFAAELRFSPFTPAVDSDPSLRGSTPYARAFGSSPRVLVEAEFDWQALRIPHFGTLGPGLALGYTAMSGAAQFTMPHGPSMTTMSGETTSLDIYPIDAMAVLRVDVFWHEMGIPLVPYLKAGVGYALWRATNTVGTSVYVDPNSGRSISGKGGSLGTHFALGIGLNINFLDEYAAKGFDEEVGVNGTYVFAEWTREDLAGAGIQSDPLRVGGTSWTFGLAFEF